MPCCTGHHRGVRAGCQGHVLVSRILLFILWSPSLCFYAAETAQVAGAAGAAQYAGAGGIPRMVFGEGRGLGERFAPIWASSATLLPKPGAERGRAGLRTLDHSGLAGHIDASSSASARALRDFVISRGLYSMFWADRRPWPITERLSAASYCNMKTSTSSNSLGANKMVSCGLARCPSRMTFPLTRT